MPKTCPQISARRLRWNLARLAHTLQRRRGRAKHIAKLLGFRQNRAFHPPPLHLSVRRTSGVGSVRHQSPRPRPHKLPADTTESATEEGSSQTHSEIAGFSANRHCRRVSLPLPDQDKAAGVGKVGVRCRRRRAYRPQVRRYRRPRRSRIAERAKRVRVSALVARSISFGFSSFKVKWNLDKRRRRHPGPGEWIGRLRIGGASGHTTGGRLFHVAFSYANGGLDGRRVELR